MHLFSRCDKVSDEICFAYIALTDEIRQMNEKILECHYVDGQWVFAKLRRDRLYPNGLTTVQGKFVYTIFHEAVYQFIGQLNIGMSGVLYKT